MSIKKPIKFLLAAVATILLGLWLSTIQGHFYPDSMLLRIATKERDKALSRRKCDEVQLLTVLSSLPSGVKLFSWACLSKSEESVELMVRVEDDGYPQVFSTPLGCEQHPAIKSRGYICE